MTPMSISLMLSYEMSMRLPSSLACLRKLASDELSHTMFLHKLFFSLYKMSRNETYKTNNMIFETLQNRCGKQQSVCVISTNQKKKDHGRPSCYCYYCNSTGPSLRRLLVCSGWVPVRDCTYRRLRACQVGTIVQNVRMYVPFVLWSGGQLSFKRSSLFHTSSQDSLPKPPPSTTKNHTQPSV